MSTKFATFMPAFTFLHQPTRLFSANCTFLRRGWDSRIFLPVKARDNEVTNQFRRMLPVATLKVVSTTTFFRGTTNCRINYFWVSGSRRDSHRCRHKIDRLLQPSLKRKYFGRLRFLPLLCCQFLQLECSKHFFFIV